MKLPEPSRKGRLSLEETLAGRRSVREFADVPLTPQQLSQLLWAAQGLTATDGGRTAPSAGGLYPLELYAATAEGLFHYEPRRHALARRSEADLRSKLSRAALRQDCVRRAPLVLVVTAIHARMESKYGERAELYVHLEAGHAAQNVHLQAVALGLGSVPVAAFHEDAVRAPLDLPRDERPLYLIPVGRVP